MAALVQQPACEETSGILIEVKAILTSGSVTAGFRAPRSMMGVSKGAELWGCMVALHSTIDPRNGTDESRWAAPI